MSQMTENMWDKDCSSYRLNLEGEEEKIPDGRSDLLFVNQRRVLSVNENERKILNVLLISMSTFPPNRSINKYEYKGNVYYGEQQEPVAKMLCEQLAFKNQKLDKILLLGTDKTNGYYSQPV